MAYTTINKHTDYFNTKLYTGNNSTNNITGVGFQPDFLWIKDRSTTGESHHLMDIVRGNNKFIHTNSTAVERTGSLNTAYNTFAFASDGFNITNTSGLNDETNLTGRNYASWNWKANGTGVSNTDGSITSTVSANTTAGFSIVKYTGNGSTNQTVGHGLGVAPAFIIYKGIDAVHNWLAYHQSLGATKGIFPNLTQAAVTSSSYFDDTAPTTSVFSVTTTSGADQTNINTEDYIAYCFAEKKGYSKFGSWIGNGNADGPFVYTGFKPEFVILKNASGTNQWLMFDNVREPFNIMGTYLEPNSDAAEANFDGFDFLSNGMKMRTSDGGWNTSGSTYIYMAFGQSLVGSNNVPCTAR